MANDKINMAAFVQDIRDRQALDKPEPKQTVKEEPITQPSNGVRWPKGKATLNSQPSKMGRPKKTRKIEGGAQVSLFFDQETKMKMMMTKLNHKIEMKDLILGATILFLDKYYENGELSERGQRELEKVLDKVYGE